MRLTLTVATLIFVIDQALKYYIVQGLNLIERGSIDVIPPLLNLRMAWNTGINFGLFAGFDMRWVLITLALAISAGVLLWIWRHTSSRLVLISAGFLVGGALGNVVDRLTYGAVADFLNMSCCGFRNPYSFNVADIAIFVGAIGIAFFSDSASDTRKNSG